MNECKDLTLFIKEIVRINKGAVYPVDGNCQKAPTGEGFIIMTSNGIVVEGEEHLGSDTYLDAVISYKKAVRDYINPNMWSVGLGGEKSPKTLYWRQKPVVEVLRRWKNLKNKERDEKWCKFLIYSRLLYSDKPITNYNSLSGCYKKGLL